MNKRIVIILNELKNQSINTSKYKQKIFKKYGNENRNRNKS